MEMNEIIVIDDDNDLEEGEIADDEVPEVEVIVQPEEKPKQLPRRYTLHDKGSNSKHKNCKHKDRNKFQNISKLETIHRKKHRTSCPRRNSENFKLKHKEVHHSHSSSTIKSAFKNYTSPPRAPPLPKQVNSNHQNSGNKVNFQKFLTACKKAKEPMTRQMEKAKNSEDSSLQKNESVLNDSSNTNISPEKGKVPESLPLVDLTEKTNSEESEEEDVEELRRIALATRAKIQQTNEVDDNSLNEVPKCVNTLPSINGVSLDHVVETFQGECDNDSRDNYEVVDMDLDEENSFQVINDDNLYVIDKMPAVTEFSPSLTNAHLSQSIENHNSTVKDENHLGPNQMHPIDDFEEQLLRAEVIASMNSTRQKHLSPPKNSNHIEDKKSEFIAKVDLLHNAVSTLHTEMKPKPCTIYSKEPLQNSVRQPSKRFIDAKSKFKNFKTNKINAPSPPLRGVNTVQERLIITLNNDTTTDESEEETNENVASQNVPMSSIEALISSARQKSDAAQLSNGNSANVSCLSKAQQEEYNSLKKLLAEKTQYSVPAPVVKENPTDQSQINLLIKKISVAKANLEKELLIKTQEEKELLEKKKNYMASKLRVQLLKEKLHAAEKIRAVNLENWKQSSAKLDIIRKSVSKRELLLKMLETELNIKNACADSVPIKPPVLK